MCSGVSGSGSGDFLVGSNFDKCSYHRTIHKPYTDSIQIITITFLLFPKNVLSSLINQFIYFHSQVPTRCEFYCSLHADDIEERK